MALGDPYATTAELKARMDIDDTDDDDRMDAVLAAVSREIESYCRRQFNDAGTASARVYQPRNLQLLVADDFHTTAGLEVATGTDGTYPTTWTVADYQLEPLNGIVSGQAGWPYWRLRAVGACWFDRCTRPTVQVTARWGWAEVPAPVKEACLISAAEAFKLGDAPFGVAGFGEFGPVRVRMNSRAQSLLAPYRRDPILVG
ncbi:phage head-tail connector protein [Micromonospora sp. NPDC005113]